MLKVKTRNLVAIAVLLACLALAMPVHAQDTNEIIAVVPDSAQTGTTGLLVSFTLDSDVPPPPICSRAMMLRLTKALQSGPAPLTLNRTGMHLLPGQSQLLRQ